MTPRIAFAVCLVLSLTGGCVGAQTVDGPATPQLIAESFGAAPAYFRLRDGDRVAVFRPQNYGDAVCGENICVSKSEIIGVQFTTAGDRAQNLILLPLVPVFAGAVVSPYTPTGKEAPFPPDRAAPECAAHSMPSPPASALGSMQGMANWVWTSRVEIDALCLAQVSGWLLDYGDKTVAHELWLLADVREAWAMARCRNTVIGDKRLVPPLGSGARGDTAWLRRIREMIADQDSFDARAPTKVCEGKGGVAPAEQWEERKQLLAERLDPFSRHPLVVTGEVDASRLHHDGRHQPAIRWIPAR